MISLKSGFLIGIILAVVAILLGLFGMVLALSPKTRGGIVSVIGVVGGLIGIVAALFRLIGGNVI